MATIEVSRIKTDGTVSVFKQPRNVMFLARLLGAKYGGKGNCKSLADEHLQNLALAMDAKEFHVTIDGIESVCTKADLKNAITAMKATMQAYSKASKLAAELKLAKSEYQDACKNVQKYVKVTGKQGKETSSKASKKASKSQAADEEMK